jgi:hypothetical protein
LGVPLEVRLTGNDGQVEDVMQLQNLREEEPDPALFTIPTDYKITTCAAPGMYQKQKIKIPVCANFWEAP